MFDKIASAVHISNVTRYLLLTLSITSVDLKTSTVCNYPYILYISADKNTNSVLETLQDVEGEILVC